MASPTAARRARWRAADDSLRKIFPELPSQDGGWRRMPSSPRWCRKTPRGGDQDPQQTTADGLARAQAQLDSVEKEVAEGIGKLRLVSPEATYPLEPLTPAVARRLGDLVLREVAQGASLPDAILQVRISPPALI